MSLHSWAASLAGSNSSSVSSDNRAQMDEPSGSFRYTRPCTHAPRLLEAEHEHERIQFKSQKELGNGLRGSCEFGFARA